MKQFRILWLPVVAASFLIASCQRDDSNPAPSHLSVDKTVLTESADGFRDSIQINSNVSWTLTGAPAFLTLSPTSGQGNAKVYLSGPANTGTAALTGTLVLSGSNGAKTVNINISQSGTAAAFTTDSTAITVAPWQNFKDSFMVISNVSWTLSGLPAWLTASATAGTGNAKVYLTVNQSNQGNASQTATIMVTPAAASGLPARSINLTQTAFAISSFSPATLPAGDQTTTITITGTFDPSANPVVAFNGTQASVTGHSANSITVTLPPGATTGPITVGLGFQALTSANNFTVSNSWVPISGSINALYNQAVSFVLNGKIYMGLGTNSAGYNNDFKVYDPQANTWTQGPVVPGAMMLRADATSFVFNNKAYIGFGSRNGTNVNDWWSFDGVNFTKIPDFPAAFSDMGTSFVINNLAYVNAGNTPALYSFDPATSTWALVNNSFPALRYNSSFSVGGKGYVVGGLLNNQSSNAMYVFDPLANTVTSAAAVPTQGPLSPTYTINGKAYLYWNGTYQFDPASGTWTDLHTNLTAAFYGAAINGTAYLWQPNGTLYKFVP